MTSRSRPFRRLAMPLWLTLGESGRHWTALIALSTGLFFVIDWVPCVMVEDFETAWPPQVWISADHGGGDIDPSAAHDGSHGLLNAPWHYRTDVSIKTGARISLWARANSDRSGRLYMGFDADNGGCKSLVVGFNTSDFRFHDNPNYQFTELSSVSYSYQGQHWYRVEIEIEGGGNVVGRLYDSDGTTLLTSVTHTFPNTGNGGVALRTFGGVAVDTLTFCP